jgi:hypothetical protein
LGHGFDVTRQLEWADRGRGSKKVNWGQRHIPKVVRTAGEPC